MDHRQENPEQALTICQFITPALPLLVLCREEEIAGVTQLPFCNSRSDSERKQGKYIVVEKQ